MGQGVLKELKVIGKRAKLIQIQNKYKYSRAIRARRQYRKLLVREQISMYPISCLVASQSNLTKERNVVLENITDC